MDDYLIKKIKKYSFAIIFSVTYLILMLNRVELKKNSPEFIVFFLNTMPNFFSGIFFTITFYNVFQKKLNSYLSTIFAAILTGSWLTIEEYYDIFSHNIYFDYYDILMSWVGVFMAFIILKTIRKE